MPIGPSNRIVVEVDSDLKRQLHIILVQEGITLKEWFHRQARYYIKQSVEKPQLPINGLVSQDE